MSGTNKSRGYVDIKLNTYNACSTFCNIDASNLHSIMFNNRVTTDVSDDVLILRRTECWSLRS